MSELPVSDARAARRAGSRHGRPPTAGRNADRDLDSMLLRLAVVPAAVVTALGAVTTAVLVATDLPRPAELVVSGIAAVGCLVALAGGALRAGTAARAIRRDRAARAAAAEQDNHRWASRMRLAVSDSQDELQRLAEALYRGERPVPPVPEPEPGPGEHPFVLAEHDIRQAMRGAQASFVQLASRRQVDVFVNLARRLQSLIGRAIKELDELEREVEDPDLLKGLFSVDHLATRVRRQAESLAVLGGAVSRRFSKPVRLYTVLRSSVAEVEQYARVKVVPPIDGNLRGHAVADAIHLVAELVENATMFSPPETYVLLRTQKVTAGVAIEVEDRGVGMPAETQQRMNELLTAPEQFDIGELLKDGRIGLYVVATLARRHGIAVRLHSNIYGGTQAVVVLPHSLLGEAEQRPERETGAARPPAPRPAALAEAQPPATAGPVAALPSRDAARQRAALPAHTPLHTPLPAPLPAPVSGPVSGPASGSEPPAALPDTAIALSAASGAQAAAPARGYPTAPAAAAASRGAEPTSRGAEPAAGEPPRVAPPRGARPPLPHRTGSHMAPQLREVTEARREPAVGHSPGLMAAFQEGFNRAGEQDGQPGHDDPVG